MVTMTMVMAMMVEMNFGYTDNGSDDFGHDDDGRHDYGDANDGGDDFTVTGNTSTPVVHTK